MDDAEANIGKLNAQKDIAVGYKDQNRYLDGQKSYLKQSYDYQVKIAELTNDEVKKAQLQAEYQKALTDLEEEKFENIQQHYDNLISLSDNKNSDYQNQMDIIEAQGKNIQKSLYKSQKSIAAQQKSTLEEELKLLEEQNKAIPQGTNEWYDNLSAIQDVKNEIAECVKTAYELNNAINGLYNTMYNDIGNAIQRIADEQEFLQGLFAHEKNVDPDTAGFTDAGLSNLGALTAGYDSYKNKSASDKEYLDRLIALKDAGKYGENADQELPFNSLDDLENRINEVYDTWQSDIKDTYSTESRIVDLMNEKYQSQLDLIRKLVDERKEALQTEKDLHDYQRQVSSQVKDINAIQQQIAAYRGDTSQEGMAKLQSLQKSLMEKQDELKETEFGKAISDQNDLLDKLYTEYEELISKKLDDFMGLVREGLDTANANTAAISDYLNTVAGDNGYVAQFKDLFADFKGSQDIIGTNINENVTAIKEKVVDASGTEETAENNSSGTINNPLDNSHGGGFRPSSEIQQAYESKASPAVLPKEATATADNPLMLAEDFILGKKSKPTKKKNEYSDVNKKIWDYTKGKVLTSANLKELSSLLGIKYNNGKKSGSLYKKLKSINFPGFSKGGVVAVEDIEKQVKANGDNGLVSVKHGERILTPVQNENFEKFMNSDFIKNPGKYLNVPDLPNYAKIPDIKPVQAETNIGDVSFNFELPNVKDSQSLLHDIQNDKRIQKAIQSVAWNPMLGKSVNNVKHIH